MMDETNKNQFMGAFAADILAGRHSSIQGKWNDQPYEILFTPEDAPGTTFAINKASPEIIAAVVLYLAEAIRSESAK